MNCPHCGAEHDEQADGRFCNNCGMSVRAFAVPTSSSQSGTPGTQEEEEAKIRCRFCGVRSPPPVCVGCGSKLPLPDDWEE